MKRMFCGLGSGLGYISVALLTYPLALSSADVLTQRNDNLRSGLNLAETVLTPASVRMPGAFGKLYFRILDANAYAQPLYVTGLEIRKQSHNVIIVATENNTIYAFEDDPQNKNPQQPPLWKAQLSPSIPAEELSQDLGKGVGGCDNLTTQIGITGTPVIDRPNYVLYVVAKTKSAGQYEQMLYALELRTGEVLRKIAVQGSVVGRGVGSDASGRIVFRPAIQLNRPGLLFDHGRLYVAFGSHCDVGDFHGWLFAYKPTTFELADVFVTTPTTVGEYNGQGGIWQSGTGPAADEAGNVYISVGNGGYDPSAGDYGDSVLKLRLQNEKFSVTGWFSPTNQEVLKIQDADLGSAGPLLVPGTGLLATAGKEGKLYLLDREAMKGAVSALQEIPVTPGPHYFGRATDYGAVRYWNIHGTPLSHQTAAGRLLYVCGEEDPVRAFRLVATNVAGPFRVESAIPFASSD
jgi:hypothetical protein